uniref:Uncharacterized protein n=1 Tax=Caenorhabditis tropicalis TaxID=1561998 RepID=A0A1I7UGW2_9PELO
MPLSTPNTLSSANKMLNALIKEEDLPIWRQPPPIGHKMPEVPQRNPQRPITIEQYCNALTHQSESFIAVNPNDMMLKRVILKEIEEIPSFWQSSNAHHRQKFFPRIGCGVYQRTGLLVTPDAIKRQFNLIRNSLRERLRKGIVVQKLNPKETEEHMWGMPLYPSIRYLRSTLEEWERKTRYKLLVDPNGEPIVFDLDDDDDLEEVVPEPEEYQFEEEVVEMIDANPGHLPPVDQDQSFNNKGQIKRDPAGYQAPIIQQQATPRRPNDNYHPPLPQNPVDTFYQNQMMAATLSPVQEEDLKMDVMQISYHMNRVAREQPDKAKTIRFAMLQTILAFDRNEYHSVGDLFTDLAKTFQ